MQAQRDTRSLFHTAATASYLTGWTQDAIKHTSHDHAHHIPQHLDPIRPNTDIIHTHSPASWPAQDVHPFVLNAPVINSRYRQSPTDAAAAAALTASTGRAAAPAKPKGAASIPFDARQVLDLFGSMDCGTHVLDSVHISDRSGVDPATGYYRCAGSLSLLPA